MGGQPTTKRVTLVVALGGEVLGSLEPFEVDVPWWQEVEPISRRLPDLAVLRLLEATPEDDALLGGDVTYLAEPLDGRWEGAHGARLVPWDGTLDDHPLRMPWARPGGPTGDLEFARSVVGAHGTPVQHRTWNLSSIWSIPSRSGRAWLKCVPGFFAHEPRVLELLAGHPVPRPLAVDGHRLLLDALPGVDGYGATYDEHCTLIDELVEIQRWSAEHLDDLGAAGVPDRRLPELVRLARRVVERRAPSDESLTELLDDAPARLSELGGCGLPDVLVHGDAHPGNARLGEGAGRGLWFDWGDSCLGHALTDLAVLDRPGVEHADELRAHWLGAWGTAVPGSDPARAWELLRPLAALGAAVVYQGFLDAIEPSERVYHEGDVLPWLRLAARLARGDP